MVLPSIGGEYGIRKLVVCSSDLVDCVCAIAFCRPGAGRWSPVQRPEGVGRLLDIAVHRGELYALYDRDTLCAYDLGEAADGHGVSRRCISGVRPREAEARFLAFEARHYLVPSPSRGTLLLVRSIGATFDVFELGTTDGDGGRWSQVTSLADDEALFVGARSSRALAASHYGGAVRGNRIYLAGEAHRGRNYLDEAARGSMGVYDMSSGAISSIGLPRGSFDDDCQTTGSWLFLSTAG